MKSANRLLLMGQDLSLNELDAVAQGRVELELGETVQAKLQDSRSWLLNHLQKGVKIYGTNTGVGALFTKDIPEAQQSELALNLVRSHCCGVGPPLERITTRAIIFAAISKFSQGYSGVRPQLAQALCDFLNHDITPIVPSAGSIGSLTHMAQIGNALLGEGQCTFKGEILPSKKAMDTCGLKPLLLEPGEGLPLISGTPSLVGIGGRALNAAQSLLNCADLCAALSFEALRANPNSLHPKVHELRPHPGQKEVAQRLRELTKDSELLSLDKLQDCLSLRTTPQVHGSIRQTVSWGIETLNLELNSATDNPLILEEEVLSACNAHGEPISQCMDALSVALAELGNIAERRTDRLLNFRMNGLPPFLAQNPGLESGLMMLQYTSAYLVSENKVLAHPVSVDSIPMSAFQEDHVNMGTLGALMAVRVARNVSRILAVELMTARTALLFLEPKKAAPKLRPVIAELDSLVPIITSDRVLGPDIEKLAELIYEGRF